MLWYVLLLLLVYYFVMRWYVLGVVPRCMDSLYFIRCSQTIDYFYDNMSVVLYDVQYILFWCFGAYVLSSTLYMCYFSHFSDLFQECQIIYLRTLRTMQTTSYIPT